MRTVHVLPPVSIIRVLQAVELAPHIAQFGGVADQRFFPALELLIQRGDDRLPIGGVLGGLGLVRQTI